MTRPKGDSVIESDRNTFESAQDNGFPRSGAIRLHVAAKLAITGPAMHACVRPPAQRAAHRKHLQVYRERSKPYIAVRMPESSLEGERMRSIAQEIGPTLPAIDSAQTLW